MQAPNSIYGFDDNDIVITPTTLEELDRHKNDYGEPGFNAREAIRLLSELKEKGNFLDGIEINGNGSVRIEFNHVDEKLPKGWDPDKPDNRILQCAQALKNENTILVTNDTLMSIKASIIGIPVQFYLNTRASSESIKYTGRREVWAMPEAIEKKFKNHALTVNDLYDFNDTPFLENEFVIIHNAIDTKSTLLGTYKKGIIQPLRYADYRPWEITPRNVGQIFAQEALLTPAQEVPLVILKGPAGTAKTFYSLAVGLQKVIEEKEYNSLLITRPNIKFDEDIGYLKGDEMDKVGPLIRPCFDNLEQLIASHASSKEEIEEADETIQMFFEKGLIKAEAMAYMRGRSLKNKFVLIDECQNSTPNQMLGLITRVGLGTKIVITGDVKQIDNPKLDKRNNGLAFASERMKDCEYCMQVAFDETECERSELSRIASERLSTNKLML